MKLIPLRTFILLLLAFLSLSSTAHAADIAAGKDKAAACLQCHGSNGNSKNPQYPSLAGQRAAYLESQLINFQTGQRTELFMDASQRTNSVMQDMVAKLTKSDISNISAYFAGLTPETAGASDLSLAEKGEKKFGICTGCHGSSAQGRDVFPKLAGQQPKYIEKQLLDFKNGSRKGGPMNVMAL
jgi:cytochrome c553